MLESLEPVIELVTLVDTKLFRKIRKFLHRIHLRILGKAASNFTIKRILTPLRLNPYSLHPIGTATLYNSGLSV